jgi:hypothetical protein
MNSSTLLLLATLSCGQTTQLTVESHLTSYRVTFEKDEATLFIPPGYKPREGRFVDIVLHLHGAPAVVEAALVETRWPAPAVLIEFNRKGLSSVYAKPFSDPALFPRLLDSTISAIKDQKLADDPRVGRVVVSSFSAGFGGVRELLKVPESFAAIDGLIMLDSIYCGYTGKATDHKVDPALMDGFRRFALEAANSRKTFLLTHSEQVPEGYASTTETADDLIDAVGGKASASKADWGQGLMQTRIASKGKFVVIGFAGKEGDDHMKHLRQVAKLWKRFLAVDEGASR